VVETEAYRGMRDPASHAFGGKRKRNALMFGKAGHSYVYFSYGFHWMLNVTTEPEGHPGAVLIRAIEPLEGVETMRERRGAVGMDHLADGPGRLTKALAIDGSLSGEDLMKSEVLYFERGSPVKEVYVGPRVGISQGAGLKWRFAVAGNAFVSKAKGAASSQNP
jgi:DNA-3-methyladenine glycosylase